MYVFTQDADIVYAIYECCVQISYFLLNTLVLLHHEITRQRDVEIIMGKGLELGIWDSVF